MVERMSRPWSSVPSRKRRSPRSSHAGGSVGVDEFQRFQVVGIVRRDQRREQRAATISSAVRTRRRDDELGAQEAVEQVAVDECGEPAP